MTVGLSDPQAFGDLPCASHAEEAWKTQCLPVEVLQHGQSVLRVHCTNGNAHLSVMSMLHTFLWRLRFDLSSGMWKF